MEAENFVDSTRLPARFSEEPLTLEWINEALPLLYKHYREIAHYQDIPLDIDVESYLTAYDHGSVKLYTSRDTNGELIGYACYFVRKNIHYSDSLQAVQDVIYLDPTRRGTGGRFLLWCDSKLRELGVQVVYHHVKLAFDFGPMLERFGYEHIENIWARRLDK